MARTSNTPKKTKLKVLISGLKFILAVTFIIAISTFLLSELLPPFNSSPAAQRIVKTSDDIQRAIGIALYQNGQTTTLFEHLSDGDVSRCRSQAVDKHLDQKGILDCVTSAFHSARLQGHDLQKSLYEARDKISADLTSLENAAEASQSFLLVAYDQLKRLLKWLGPSSCAILVSMIALAVALTRRSFWTYFKGNASLSLPGGLKIDFDNIEAYRAAIRERYFDLDSEISQTYRTKLAEQNLDRLFSEVKKQIDQWFLSSRSINLGAFRHRATLFVPGFLGDELVQATGYVGKDLTAESSGVGRRFSVRYGIIGMSWRMQHSLYNPNVTNNCNDLVRSWGFTNVESSHIGGGNAALIAFAVRSDTPNADPLGIIYLEAYQSEVFGADKKGTIDQKGLYPNDADIEKLWAQIAQSSAVKNLVNKLAALRVDLRWDNKIVEAPGR